MTRWRGWIRSWTGSARCTSFSWWPAKERLPLEARRALWERVFARLPERAAPLDALLEFVPGDSAQDVVRDAATLRDLLA